MTTITNTGVTTTDLTVDTSTIKVDSANNRVGIGTASPSSNLHVSGGAGANIAIQSSAGTHWRIGDGVGSTNGNLVIYDYTDSRKVLEIDTLGRITKQNTPHLMALGFHSFISGTHFGKFQTITTNTGNHYNNTDGRFTCPVDGRYFVSAFSGYKQATNHAGVGIAYNNSVLAYGWSEGDDRHATQGTTLVYDANANDYFNYFCHSSYTSPILPTGSDHHSFFSVYLLG